MLTCWLIWLVAIIIFLVVIEFIRDRLAHEVALDDLSDDELRDLFRLVMAFLTLRLRSRLT